MMSVYIMRAHGVGKIKVGVTNDLPRRLAEIQAMCPAPISVIDTLPGESFETEKAMHTLMSEHRLHGEWFSVDGLPTAMRWFSIVRAARSDLATMMAWYMPAEKIAHLISQLLILDMVQIADELRALTGPRGIDDREINNNDLDDGLAARAAMGCAEMMAEHFPPQAWNEAKARLGTIHQARDIMVDFYNITGRSIMDRRYGGDA